MNKDNKNEIKKGKYHNDYSPRYQKPYNIYEKAKQHIKDIKKEESHQKECDKNLFDHSL